ncbi:hypothetical protein Ddye_028220 [Dipteronia dyeriana]|uniref:RNase H type-1 domain-containing protein n=1 Tax=Dipteronia dyeriana TaxID=168575 RepID=A0AAD9WS58_9ROSI|nr:hypothetical protein Ddye_028220 [Dipteronia dyeriana]
MWDSVFLKEVFLRIFALSVKKQGIIKNLGCWAGRVFSAQGSGVFLTVAEGIGWLVGLAFVGVRRIEGLGLLCFLRFHGQFGRIQDSNMAEVAAILKACELCGSKHALASKKIIIVSESKVVISWIKNKKFRSFSYLNILYNIKSLLHHLGDVKVCYNPRSINSFADKLAKMGSTNSGDRIS